MRKLIKEYKEALKKVNQALRKAEDPNTRALLGGMSSDLRYAIEWMRTGRMPGARRGIDRRGVYQREIVKDPEFFEDAVAPEPIESTVTEFDRERMDDALCELTEREREIYEMAKAGGMPYEKIAEALFISKGTVQDTIKRSDNKIQKRKKESMFCMAFEVPEGDFDENE